jgi:hypothetical protein
MTVVGPRLSESFLGMCVLNATWSASKLVGRNHECDDHVLHELWSTLAEKELPSPNAVTMNGATATSKAFLKKNKKTCGTARDISCVNIST